MSSSNILRLLRDALTLNGEQLDMASGDVLKIRPGVDDTGSINIGDGTNDLDVKVFLGTTGEYVLFDVGNSRLDIACNTRVTDPTVTAEHGGGAIGTGVAPVTTRRTVNGTIITEIKVDITGLKCKGDAQGDALGLTGDAYIGRNVIATNGVIYRIEMICLETPAGTATSTLDIDLMAEDDSDVAYDGPVDDTVIAKAASWAAGQVTITNVPALVADDYLYLGEGDTAASTGTYTAGQFIVRLYGHAVMT